MSRRRVDDFGNVACETCTLVQVFAEGASCGVCGAPLYRDDAATALPNPQIGRSDIPFDVDGRRVVLVDDVLFHGRTIRAALDALHDLGRPRRVQLAVLVDRGHREFPIRADFVGKNIPTSSTQRVKVRLTETGGDDTVVIEDAR